MSASGSQIVERTAREIATASRDKGKRNPPPLPPSLASKLPIAGIPYSLGSSSSALTGPPSSTNPALDDLWTATLRDQMQIRPSALDASGTSTSTPTPLPLPIPPLNPSMASSTGRPLDSVPLPALASKAKVPADLLPTAKRFSQYSLKALADRKKRQLSVQLKQGDIFPLSSILSPSDASTLYFCLPFVSSAPVTSLIYSTERHERSIQGLQAALANVLGPTVIVVRSGEFIFGGYASDPWRNDESRFGNPKCFLFSITLDLKFPYHGRQKDGQSSIAGMGGQWGRTQHDCLSGGPDYLQFGIRDLCLRGDLRGCTSELEFSYGVGLVPGSDDAKSILAGGTLFVADEVEAWQIQ
jgi:hypothetical protein